MQTMYRELAEWWPLLSPPEGYAEEAAVFRDILREHVPDGRTMLELGSGGGNNALHLKRWFEMTLSDVSEDMLSVSRKLNPECAHVQGDMRSLQLDQSFDAVFVHDAICYMTTEADLNAAFQTAYRHLRSGGAALFAPDWVKETFETGTEVGGDDGEFGGVRYLEWVFDPDPDDTTYNVEYVVAVRDVHNEVRVVHDRHVEGLFSEATWLRLLEAIGFEVQSMPDPVAPGRILFVGRKP